MILRSYGSSSSGNLYTLSDGRTNLMIECGFPAQKIREKIGAITHYDGCVVTHSHNDHSKSLCDLVSIIPVYATEETFFAKNSQNHFNSKILKFLTWRKIGTMEVYTFPTVHDVPGSASFVFSSGKEKILFVTDTKRIDYAIDGLTQIAIECNYVESVIIKNMESGTLNYAMCHRVLNTHMGLESVCDYLRKIDKSKLREIFILHLSSGNSDERIIRDTIEGITGIPTTIFDEA